MKSIEIFRVKISDGIITDEYRFTSLPNEADILATITDEVENPRYPPKPNSFWPTPNFGIGGMSFSLASAYMRIVREGRYSIYRDRMYANGYHAT